MKFLLVAACIFVVANGQLDKLRESLNQKLSECKELVGGSDADVDQYKHRITPESEAGKCMIACVNKKIKIQDENGKINPDVARASAEALKNIDEKWYNTFKSNTEKCLKEVVDGPDECAIAAQWYSCLRKGNDEAKLPLLFVDA